MNNSLAYSDVHLLPNYSVVNTRQDCDTSVTLGPYTFSIPVIPANMKAVISPVIASKLIQERCFYIMHRFGIDIFEFVQEMSGPQRGISYNSISIGVKQDSFDLIDRLCEHQKKPHYITIDVAHAHCLNVRKIIEYTRDHLGDSVYIIAGNVCTPEGVKALSAWGANAVKVGIGQGSPCTTKDKTGFTMPMFTCVLECSNQTDMNGDKIPIIADGGIRHSGDITKALVAGATMVMTGKIFARCSDSPAETIVTDTGKHKIYYGSASEENKGHNRNVEGIKKCLCVDSMTYIDKINEIKQDLQSSISYAGGDSLDVLSLDNVRYRINH